MSRTDPHGEVVDLAADLVGIETENPPGNERGCAEYVRDWFEARDIDADLVGEPYADRPQVVARVGEGSPTLVLNGHVDVVPAGDREQWTGDPYEPRIEDGRLYGRGSVDMKTGVAIGMLTLARLREAVESGDLDGSLVMQAVIGEETAEPGTRTLLERGHGGDYGIVLEPTGMRTATSEKGLAWYEISVAGEPSHASRPDQGTNAIHGARPVLDALEEYDAAVRERTDPLVGRAYATVTKFEAGTKENVVPERATITVDRRFLPSESAEDIDGEVDSLLAGIEGVETEWERTRTYESASIPEAGELADTLREHSAAVAGVDTDPWGVQASTDVRNFVNDAGIEAVTWGPGDLAQAHTYDEYVELAAAEQGLEVLERAARDLIGEA